MCILPGDESARFFFFKNSCNSLESDLNSSPSAVQFLASLPLKHLDCDNLRQDAMQLVSGSDLLERGI